MKSVRSRRSELSAARMMLLRDSGRQMREGQGGAAGPRIAPDPIPDETFAAFLRTTSRAILNRAVCSARARRRLIRVDHFFESSAQPLAYVLGIPLGFGPDGVFWAMAIAFSVMSVVSAMLFRRSRWKLKRV